MVTPPGELSDVAVWVRWAIGGVAMVLLTIASAGVARLTVIEDQEDEKVLTQMERQSEKLATIDARLAVLEARTSDRFTGAEARAHQAASLRIHQQHAGEIAELQDRVRALELRVERRIGGSP